MAELSANEGTRKGDQEEEQKGAVPRLAEGAGRLKVKEREESAVKRRWKEKEERENGRRR